MMENKPMWIVVHPLKQIFTFINDGNALTPCHHSSKEAGYFNVLFFGKKMWNGNWVVFNKALLVVLKDFAVEEFF